MDSFPVTQSNGGPLLLLETASLGLWRGYGSSGPSDEDHYEIACSVEGVAGLIPLGEGWAVALATDPTQPAFFCRVAGLLCVIASFGQLQEDLMTSAEIAMSQAPTCQLPLAVTSTELLVFEASLSGKEARLEPEEREERLPAISASLAAGDYWLRSHWLSDDSLDESIAHVFVPKDSNSVSST